MGRQNRCRIFKRALHNLNDASDWTLASSLFGVKTFYRREEDGSLSLKLEGELKDCPLFEQVCVLKEVDLHYKWAPFCTSSMTIADLDKLDTVGWFVIGLANFGLSRDGCFRVIGCDHIMEEGSIIVAGQGIRDLPPDAPSPRDTYLCEDPVLDNLDIPPIPTRRGGGRMTIRTVEAVIHVTSPTSARTRLVANIDPNMTFLPQPLLEFVMKNLAGVLLAKLQTAAKKIPRNPVTNEHARRMRDEEDFYRHWLMKKFLAVCQHNGWEMPHVSAFELTEEQLRHDHKLAEKRAQKNVNRRAVSFDLPPEQNEVSDDLERYRRQNSAPMPSESNNSIPHNEFESDAVSELTSKSSRSIALNIKQAMKEREERKKQKKEEKVAEQRRRAAERLRPKEFSPDKQKRLEELRTLKAERTSQDYSSDSSVKESDPRVESEPVQRGGALPTAPTLRHSNSAPERTTRPTAKSGKRASVSEQFTDLLYRQQPLTRLLVLLLLTILLFTLLHPKLLLNLLYPDFESHWSDHSSTRITALKGSGVILYLLLCTAAHFALCDIALVYAFDSMELGSKAGRRLRKFYSVQVRLGVALGSFGIAGVAIGKSLTKVFLRYLFWSIVHVADILGPRIPTFVSGTVGAIGASVGRAVGTAGNVTNMVIQSNPVTGSVGSLVHRFFAVFSFLWNGTQSFATESVAIVNDEVEATPWYEESFSLAKYLFAYTSVFLVSSLILFNLSSKQAAKEVKGIFSERDDLSTQASDMDSRSQARSRGGFEPDLSNIPEHPGEIALERKEASDEQGSLRRRKA